MAEPHAQQENQVLGPDAPGTERTARQLRPRRGDAVKATPPCTPWGCVNCGAKGEQHEADTWLPLGAREPQPQTETWRRSHRLPRIKGGASSISPSSEAGITMQMRGPLPVEAPGALRGQGVSCTWPPLVSLRP